MSDTDDGMITLLPPGCEMAQNGTVVWIRFPTEDDAIIFMELMKEMARGNAT